MPPLRHIQGIAGEGLVSTKKQMSFLVRKLRRKLELTREKFAATLGVSFATLNRWENGRANPSPLAIQCLEALLRDLGEEGGRLPKK